MVFLPTHRRQPKPWAAYATAAIVLHCLAIALLVNGAGDGTIGEPIDIELVEMVPDASDAFAAPPEDNPIAPVPINPGLETPIDPADRKATSDPVLADPTAPDPTVPEPIVPEPTVPEPTVSEQPGPEQPGPEPTAPVQSPPVQSPPVQTPPDQTAPTPSTAPANPEPVPTNSPIASPSAPANPTQNPADTPQGQVNVPSQNPGIGLNVGLAIVRYGVSDIPLVRRATPKETSQQFVLDPSQFACTRLVTPEASRDLGQPVTLALAIDARGQVTDIATRAADFLSPDYLALAQCIVNQWAFDPAIDQTEQGETIPRPDNATVTLTLQRQSL